MDELRTSVQNAVVEQKDPVLVYKFEAFELLQQVLNEVNKEVLTLLYKADLHVENSKPQAAKVEPARDDFSKLKVKHNEVEDERRRRMEDERRVMAATGNDAPERKLSRTELEVQDSAHTVLLEYFNQPVPAPERRHPANPSSAIGKQDDLPN